MHFTWYYLSNHTVFLRLCAKFPFLCRLEQAPLPLDLDSQT